MSSYEHLINEYRINQRLNKKYGQVIEPVHLNKNNCVYFWKPSIGYTNDPVSSTQFIRNMNIIGLNTLRFNITDVDESRKMLYNFIENLTSVRAYTAIALNVPVVIAAIYTNFFTEVPFTKEGIPTYNVYYLGGDADCVTPHGVRKLKVYNSLFDCIYDTATTLELTYNEEECFEIMYKKLGFSLTLYRFYFLIILNLLKGEDIHETYREMDSYGSFRRLRRDRSVVPKSKVLGTPAEARRPKRPRKKDSECSKEDR